MASTSSVSPCATASASDWRRFATVDPALLAAKEAEEGIMSRSGSECCAGGMQALCVPEGMQVYVPARHGSTATARSTPGESESLQTVALP